MRRYYRNPDQLLSLLVMEMSRVTSLRNGQANRGLDNLQSIPQLFHVFCSDQQ